MDRETNETVDLIDLGVASAETQGVLEGKYDGLGLIPPAGLSDD
ncbi:benenodin family lasso peptide [Sphingomonas sp. G-3-2-10]|nr:benenodin family lasso peptide [Sphingomonas sp. G-3-2-10]NML06726.1 benenodin family lasso peptide [Sphingomonas sp. G-3-2-10]